jgi:hypothetical protein
VAYNLEYSGDRFRSAKHRFPRQNGKSAKRELHHREQPGNKLNDCKRSVLSVISVYATLSARTMWATPEPPDHGRFLITNPHSRMTTALYCVRPKTVEHVANGERNIVCFVPGRISLNPGNPPE